MVIHVWSSADHKRLFSFWRSILPNAEYRTREYLTEREVHRRPRPAPLAFSSYLLIPAAILRWTSGGSLSAGVNAIIDAPSVLGSRHIDTPCTPYRVWQAIANAGACVTKPSTP